MLTANMTHKYLYPRICHKRYCESKQDGQVTKDVTAMSPKYEVFRDEDAPVILDVEEERIKYLDSLQEKKKEDEFSGLNLKSECPFIL